MRIRSVRGNKAHSLKACTSHNGYHMATLSTYGVKKTLSVHQLVAIHFLEKPNDEDVQYDIHHIDRKKTNNNIGNRRDITHQEHFMNKEKMFSKLTTSTYKGTSWTAKSVIWRARLNADGKDIHLGYVDCDIDADKAYGAAAKMYYPNIALFKFPD